ncbi:helix-turn-helix transcriptional regulator [Leifsonia sp. NPDC058194]|uniref:helix-turn-helix transcriptional regulator n=1 Tax=Leifsonia sp. NPDC058194 TaxID=3346374 RepID=UPI0036D83F77
MSTQNRDEVREFLTTRRAKVRPEQVDLPAGPNRRVPGLRRTEVAIVAGVSVEYYSRLERGNLAGASESVLNAVASALLLDEAERDHLFDLARTANGSPSRRPRARSRSTTVRPSLQLLLDAVTGGPALIRNGRMDILATNLLARAVHVEAYAAVPERPVNLARFAFLHRESAERFYPDWDVASDIIVAILRVEAGRDPYDRDLQDLIGELSTRSDEFRTKWGDHNVRRHVTGVKRFLHPVVGDLEFLFEGTELPGTPGWHLNVYLAEPGTPTEDAMRLLSSWAATQEELHIPAVRDDPRSATATITPRDAD